MFEIEEIPSWDALESLRGEWSDLCNRSPRVTPFQRPEWLLPWGRAFPPGEPWVLAVRREGRLAALAPLLVYPNEGKRAVAFCGGGVSDYCDVVTDPDGEEEAVSALLAHLVDHRDRWEIADFEPLPGGSPLLRTAEGYAESRDVCPGIDLPERVEDLHEVVPTRQLANLRKYRRKAGKLGELRLHSDDPWEEKLEVLLRFYLARRGETDGDTLRAFHREVAAGFHARGALGLHLLCLNGDPLAGLYGFRERDTFYCYMQGFDEQWAKLSPGAMVVGAVIEESIRQGARRIDFLRGREPYKYWWGGTDRETFRRIF
ncbi:MAG TPA: GNAT family N-acetyltransferase [Thermoanaerobaculia bacterium]|nr:GNAT family N-acetyltransferase [Thermoanaerobaculia bacterium]